MPPCDWDESAARQDEIEKALQDLEAGLATGRIGVEVGPQGAVAFRGWEADSRRGMTDLCAYNKLTARGAPEIREAVRRAEVKSGRKVSKSAVAAGHHSHDGGKTWGKHKK